MVKIALFGIIASILTLKIKSIRPEYSLVIGLVSSLFLAIYALDEMGKIIDLFGAIESYSGIPGTYIQILLKLVGISFLCEFASNICKDAGQATMAKQVEMAGNLSILVVSLPILESLLTTLERLMG